MITLKIEKISDTQAKFLLSRNDLIERGINTSDFRNGSEKIKKLIREITEQAAITCGFDVNGQDGTPIMIEALPFESDSILVIVSKITRNMGNNFEEKMITAPSSRLQRHFWKNEPVEFCNYSYSDPDNISIYTFDDMESVKRSCKRIMPYYNGNSILYKHNDKYYLLVINECIHNIAREDFDMIINEFGCRHLSNVITKGFLVEHADVIIAEDALNIVSSI